MKRSSKMKNHHHFLRLIHIQLKIFRNILIYINLKSKNVNITTCQMNKKIRNFHNPIYCQHNQITPAWLRLLKNKSVTLKPIVKVNRVTKLMTITHFNVMPTCILLPPIMELIIPVVLKIQIICCAERIFKYQIHKS